MRTMFLWMKRRGDGGNRAVGIYDCVSGGKHDRWSVRAILNAMHGQAPIQNDALAVGNRCDKAELRGANTAARDVQDDASRAREILPAIADSMEIPDLAKSLELCDSMAIEGSCGGNSKSLFPNIGKSKQRVVRPLKRKHGLSGSPTYRSWLSMIQRCTNENRADFADYGGRGIRVCKRWRAESAGFIAFVSDMGLRPEGMTLDRINVDGNYTPANSKWSDRKEQRANRRDGRAAR